MNHKQSGFFLNLSFLGVLVFCLNSGCTKNIKPERTDYNLPQVKSFAAILNLKGDTNKGKVKLNLELFYKNPDQLIFYPRGSWGSGFFKAKVSQDSILIYFPQDGKYYKNNVDNFQKDLNWGWEIKFEELLDVIVDKKINSLERAEVFYKKFEKYEQFDLAYEIEIRFKNSSQKLKIRFKEQKINPDLANGIFQLKIPATAQRVDLISD